MDGFEGDGMMAKLGDVFNLQMGKTPARANAAYWTNGTNAWVSIADLSSYEKYVGDTKEQITDLAVQESGIKVVPADTIIMSFKLSLGKTAITKVPIYTNEAIMAFLPTGKYDVCPDYFFHRFSDRDWSEGTNRAVMGATLNKATLSNMEIVIPPLDEQRRIATVLDKVSGLIAKRREQLDKLDELLKARFVEMFGDPVSNPKGWNIIRLSELGDCKNGMNFHTDDSGVEIHCLGVGDFKNLSSISDTAKLPIITLNEMPTNDYLLKNGDIVFVRSNGNKALVGRSVIVYPDDTPTTFSGFCIRFRIQNPIILPQYLLSVLKTASMRKQMTGRGANIQNLNQKILSELKIPVSPLPYQEEYIDFTIKIDKSKLTIQQSLDKLEVLKKALMQQYFG